MRYATAGLVAFLITVLGIAYVRALVLSGNTRSVTDVEGERTQTPEHSGDTDKETDTDTVPDKGDSSRKPGTDVVDIKNVIDPVNDRPASPGEFSLELNGFRIHFNEDDSRQKFREEPWRYLRSLALEPLTLHQWKVVDASDYQDAAPPICPFLGMKIDVKADVYILHRGFKVHF